MPRNIYSQLGGSLTNPLNNNGLNNILLKPASDDASGQDLTMTTKDLIKTLDEIINPSIEITEDHLEQVKNAQKFFSEYAEDLNALYGALQNNTESAPTKDPYTGEKYKTGPELAKDLKKRIENMEEKKASFSRVFNMERFSAAKKEKFREEKNKKKTRGNPFRVLMGQVGKMLDHGISKKEIVRYISKKNMWNEETISKAVDVVSDYSKKKRSKEKKFQEKESSSSINMTRVSAIDATKSIYEIAPDFTKRSTAELMARASWLNDLLSYNEKTPQGDMRKAANKDGVSAELKKIREALKARGFEENELP
jgi:hypothetical protein